MASEFQGRNICVGYNFEQTPDTSSLHNLDRQIWYAFETNLAMRLLADFGKEAPASLARNCAASMSFLSQVAADPQMLPYPSRMPIGRGNKYYHRPWRYYPVTESAETCDSVMYLDDISEFKEDFSEWLNDLEDLTSYTLNVESGLEIISESLLEAVLTYRLKAISVGLHDVKIIATAEELNDDPLTDGTFRADYETDINANWGAGSFTGSGFFGASVSDGQLNLSGGIVKYVSYDGTLNVPDGNIGCVRIKFIPNYTGIPSADYAIFSTANGASNQNLIYIYHDAPSSNLIATFYTNAAVLIGTISSAFSPVSGQEYEIEFNWDFTSGNTQLFLDGVSQGTDVSISTTTTRTTLFVGTDNLATVATDCYIEEITIFSSVQHLIDYELTEIPTRIETRVNKISVIEAPL